jgi:hypothetical protein
MGRKTKRVTITAEGRDKGKSFLITELPADQAERWAIRALLALIQSGAVISEDALHAGMASIAAIGVSALGGLSWETAQPLLEEMFTCVQYQPADARIAPQELMTGNNSQIEEVTTRLSLRLAVFELHLGFSVPDAPPTSGTSTEGENGEKPSNTPTFLESLGGWYRRALRRS